MERKIPEESEPENNKKLMKKIFIAVILVLVILTVFYKTVPVIKRYMHDKANIFSVNKEIKDGSDSIKLVSITSFPKHISLLAEYKKYYPDRYNIVVMNSKGDELKSEDSGESTEKIFSTDVTYVFKKNEKTEFQNVKILKSKAEKHRPDKLKDVQYVPLDAIFPVDVSVGNNKKITVESVNEKDGQLEIIFSAEDVPFYTFAAEGGISLYDKTMDKKNRFAYDRLLPQSLGNNRYRISVSDIREIYKDGKPLEYFRHIENSAICIGNYDDMYSEIANISLK